MEKLRKELLHSARVVTAAVIGNRRFTSGEHPVIVIP